MDEQALKSATKKENQALERKWGKAAIEAGYTAVPLVMLKYQQRLGLNPLDVNVLMQILSYWWKEGGLPRPSKKSLATAIGVDLSTVRRCLMRLEKMGLIQRCYQRTASGANRPNQYDFTGLITMLKPIAEEELEEIRKRKLRKQHQLAGKKPALKVVK
jgi:predicted transcriptional regulator